MGGEAPFMLMLSPKWASVSMEAQSEIVRRVPSSGVFSIEVTAAGV